METVREVLNRKGHDVYCVDPDASVLAALEVMAKHDIGALVVLADGVLVGIITERDYAQKIALKGRTSPKTAVREIMSTRVIYARPLQTVEECMAIMTAKAVRHLPVLEYEKASAVSETRPRRSSFSMATSSSTPPPASPPLNPACLLHWG